MRAPTCPVRLPPKSDPRALVIVPTPGLSIASTGLLRFTWFNALVKEASTLILTRSVTLKYFAIPALRLTVPGPATVPTPESPNRPIGLSAPASPEPIKHAVPGVHPGVPGRRTCPSRFRERCRRWIALRRHQIIPTRAAELRRRHRHFLDFSNEAFELLLRKPENWGVFGA
jgi:hypothetical protein